MARPFGGIFIASVLALAACAHGPVKPVLGPPPILPEPKGLRRKKPPPEWYWEALDPEITGGKKLELPAADVARLEGATPLWDALGEEGREQLRRTGLVVVGDRDQARAKMGAFYTELRDQRVPYLITLDALFFAAHVAFERALAEVDDRVIAPDLDRLLPRLAARLGAAEEQAETEISVALRVARGVVAVATALDGGTPPEDLAAVVRGEVARIDAHAGPGTSPLLGVPVDYSRFAVPSGADRPGPFKALAWLAAAPLVLVARSEEPGAPVDVSTARTNARAAMLLARLVDHDVDAELHDPHARIARLLAFVWGPPDDVSLGEYADIAEGAGVRLGDSAEVVNVVKVDRVRRRAALLRVPRVWDGSGAPARAGVSARVFPGHASPDSALLGSLTGPAVGPSTNDGTPRGLPSTLDIAAWLGGPEARAALRESGTDTFAPFDAQLAKAVAQRPADETIHASVYGSFLDAIAAWLGAPSSSAAGERASVESALAAWTWLRHDGRAMTRPRPPSARAPQEIRVTGAPLPAFVEPAPFVVARLLATLRQTQRGLASLGALEAGSPAQAALSEVEDMLGASLRVAVREANDEPLTPEDAAALASLPARLARLEADAEALVPVAADVQVDLRSRRALTSATGLVEPALVVVREPGTGRLVLAVGAHVAHHELVEPLDARTTDASLRARLDAGLPRAPYVSAFRRTR